jgi:hypothetical protein
MTGSQESFEVDLTKKENQRSQQQIAASLSLIWLVHVLLDQYFFRYNVSFNSNIKLF